MYFHVKNHYKKEHNIDKENYDLLTLIIIKLGDKVYNGEKGDEGYELFRFLNVLMYPHKREFMDTVSEYIDFSGNEELWKEMTHMTGLGQSIFEEGIQKGIEALILDNIEEKIPKERIIMKLQKRFNLTERSSMYYYEKFAPKA